MTIKNKALQNHPTCRSCPHKQAGTFRTPFEMDFICNNFTTTTNNINLSVCNSPVITTLEEEPQ